MMNKVMDQAVQDALGAQKKLGEQNEAQNHKKTHELRAVAEQFEALFLEKVFSLSRSAKLADDPLSNKGTETFQGMLDREYAQSAASSNDLGIAEALVAQFEVHVRARRP